MLYLKISSVFFITFLTLYSASAFLTNKDASLSITSKTKFILLSYIASAYPTLVDASPPIEEGKKLKKKIQKGTELLEDLNNILDDIKDHLKEKLPIDKKYLEKLLDIKNRFKDLKVDPTDLSQELLNKFRDRTLEAFSLVFQGIRESNKGQEL